MSREFGLQLANSISESFWRCIQPGGEPDGSDDTIRNNEVPAAADVALLEGHAEYHLHVSMSDCMASCCAHTAAAAVITRTRL
jgi:hypothetical protein